MICSSQHFGILWYTQIGKKPAWAFAHCLEQLSSNRKCYHLYPCGISELGQAADDAYLIVDELNKLR